MPLVGTKIEKFDVINRSKPRLDGIEKVTGRARYAADIFMDGMLYAGVLRSPYSSARVLRIDAEKARTVPGAAAVTTDPAAAWMSMPSWVRQSPRVAS